MENSDGNLNNPYASPAGNVIQTAQHTEQSWLAFLFSFQGRVPRRTWWGVRFLAVVPLFGAVFAASLFEKGHPASVAILVGGYILMVWISVAVSVKRWHDLDKSGSWFLINFVPLFGPIYSFIREGCTRGTEGPNQYGPDPT